MKIAHNITLCASFFLFACGQLNEPGTAGDERLAESSNRNLQTFFSSNEDEPADERAPTIISLTKVGKSLDVSYSPILQTDGKVIAVGRSSNEVYDAWALSRYLTSGSLDTTFATNGMIVSTNLGTGNAIPYAIEIQTDGRAVVAGRTEYSLSGNFTVLRYQTYGALDTGFNTTGIHYDATVGTARTIQIDTQGRILAGGDNGGDFAIARYTATGSLDTAFFTRGYVTTAILTDADTLYDLLLQTSGNILAIGSVRVDGGFTPDDDFAVVRYLSDGRLDTSFNTTGKRVIPIQAGCDTALTAQLQSDEKILSVGQSGSIGVNSIAITRILTDGTLDTTFATVGSLLSQPYPSSKGYRSLLLSNNKILVVGEDVTNFNALIVQYLSDGSLDTGFNLVGHQTLNLRDREYFQGVLLETSGKYTLVGTGSPLRKQNFLIARYTPTGQLDTSFFTGGYFTHSSGLSGSGRIRKLFSGAGGKIIAVGDMSDGSSVPVLGIDTLSYTVGIAQYLSSGVLDTSFNTTGVALALNTDSLKVSDVVLTTTGGFWVAGASSADILAPSKMVGVRLNSNGSMDTAFNTTGNVSIPPIVSDLAYGVALQTDGKALLSGRSYDGSRESITGVLARFRTDGTLDTSFASSGVYAAIIEDANVISAVAVEPSGSILTLGSIGDGDGDHFGAVRFLSDGSLDPAFNGTGHYKYLDSGTRTGRRILRDAENRYLFGGGGEGDSGQNCAFTRVYSDGSLDTSFMTTGMSMVDETPIGSDGTFYTVHNMLLLPNGKFLSAAPGESGGFLVSRYLTDGQLDTSFRTSGSALITLGTHAHAGDLLLTTDGRYIAGGSYLNDNYRQFGLFRVWP